jgi:hypothetical protein
VGPSGNGLILLRQVSRPDLPNRVLQNVYVHHNTVTLAGSEFAGAFQYVGDNSAFTSQGNRFDWNHWSIVGGSPFRWNNTTLSDAQWQAAGQDVSGTFTQ